MNRIHFSSLYCPDYDLDLFDQWCKHYSNFMFDSYHIYIHSPFENRKNVLDSVDILTKYNFSFCEVPNEIFGNGSLRSAMIGDFIASLPQDDRIVTADSDEFQQVPIDQYRDIALSFDVIPGIHVDRYDHTLHDASPDLPLEKQFPLEGDIEAQVLKTVDVKSRQRWPRVKKNKILCSTVKYPIALAGSHELLPLPPDSKPKVCPYVFDVHHYTWRSTIIKRMAGKDYFQAPHIWYFKKFFTKSESDIMDSEMEGIIRTHEAVEREKGWIPVNE